MKKHFINFLLLIVIVCSIFWLGGINVRAIVVNELFYTGTLEWKSNLSPDYYSAIFKVITISSIYAMVSYLFLFISVILYLSLSKIDLKSKGWLMASIILFFLFSPVEIYASVYDFKFIYEYYFGTADYYYLKELLTKRLTSLSGLPVIALFSYYTILILFVWKPLDKTKTNSQNI